MTATNGEKVGQSAAEKEKRENAAKPTAGPKAEGKGTWTAVSAKFYGAARGTAAMFNQVASAFTHSRIKLSPEIGYE